MCVPAVVIRGPVGGCAGDVGRGVVVGERCRRAGRGEAGLVRAAPGDRGARAVRPCVGRRGAGHGTRHRVRAREGHRERVVVPVAPVRRRQRGCDARRPGGVVLERKAPAAGVAGLIRARLADARRRVVRAVVTHRALTGRVRWRQPATVEEERNAQRSGEPATGGGPVIGRHLRAVRRRPVDLYDRRPDRLGRVRVSRRARDRVASGARRALGRDGDRVASGGADRGSLVLARGEGHTHVVVDPRPGAVGRPTADIDTLVSARERRHHGQSRGCRGQRDQQL